MLVETLRRYGAANNRLHRAFADSLGVHPTDAAALVEIFQAEDHGAPLTPARLAALLGLSRPATTAALNRLEQSGHVTRRRAADDGRSVTLHAAPPLIARTATWFAPLAEQADALLSRHDPAQITAALTLLAEMTRLVSAQADHAQR